jgi:hypothetical protein
MKRQSVCDVYLRRSVTMSVHGLGLPSMPMYGLARTKRLAYAVPQPQSSITPCPSRKAIPFWYVSSSP